MRVRFPAPDASGRSAIFGRYAKHLAEAELDRLGEISQGLTGRDILNVCKQAERRWVVTTLREGAAGSAGDGVDATVSVTPRAPLPSLYEEAIAKRREGMQDEAEESTRAGQPRLRQPPRLELAST